MPGKWEEFFTFPSPEKANDMTRIGEKGAAEYTAEGVDEPRVALFFSLVRGLSQERLHDLVMLCMEDAKKATFKGNLSQACDILTDLYLLAFQTRDCRGGKGEREVFYRFFYELFLMFPKTSRSFLPLIAHYGYHKDYVQMLEFLDRFDTPPAQRLQKAIMKTMADNFRRDLQIVSASSDKIDISVSLCAKYLPREGKSFAKNYKYLFNQWIQLLFPSLTLERALVEYRHKLAHVASCLDVVEGKMCDQLFSTINFAHLPGIAAKKYRKAFLNEKMKRAPIAMEQFTGNRFPENQDRIDCRQHLIACITGGQVKGKQLFPHEIIRPFLRSQGPSSAVSSYETSMLEVQWADLRAHLASTLQAKRLTPANTASDCVAAPIIDLGKLVPMVDVSGSMAGIPMEVSIALGLLVSELNHPAFRDRILTFESKPTWVVLNSSSMNLATKVNTLKNASWGGATNIEAAMVQIAKVVEANRLSIEEVPDLIIFSDMQFDTANGYNNKKEMKNGRAKEPFLESVKQRFRDLGKRIAGTPYPAPRIIFWNLRADTSGFPAQANENNVMLLSGFSPALFKFLVEGESTQQQSGALTTAAVALAINPYATLRKVLDDARYDMIRAMMMRSEEGPMLTYFHHPVATATATAADAGVLGDSSDSDLSHSSTTAMPLTPDAHAAMVATSAASTLVVTAATDHVTAVDASDVVVSVVDEEDS